MLAVTTGFFGQAPAAPHPRRPPRIRGGAFGRIEVLPADGDAPAVAFRRCGDCAHVVFVPVSMAPREPAVTQEGAPC